MQALLEGEAEALARKAIELALQGDVTALRLCLERLLPPRKARPVEIDMPEVKDAAGVLAAIAATIDAMAQGQLSPEEAATVVGVLEVKRKAIETVQLEERLRRLEAQARGASNDHAASREPAWGA